MSQTVVGIFDTATEAQSAVEALVNSGFNRDQIDLSARTGDFNQSYTDDSDSHDEGGIGGFFSSLFGTNDDEDRRRTYETVGKRGSIVTVHVDESDDAEQAADILDEYGAVDVDEKAAQYATNSYANTGSAVGAGVSGTANTYDLTAGTTDTTDVVRDGDTLSVPIIEENLQVGKRTEQTGGVRLRSRIIEKPVEESVRLRSERVVVQRNPVDRAATDADFTAFKEGEVSLTETAERAVVGKEARVVEEVTLGKTVDEHDEVIRDTVRRTDVDVEQLNPTVDTTLKTDNTTYTTGNDTRSV
ncbi:YsnF/AvaK domain-containing protein [Fibrella aquatilis]|uniref:DUF2382 domain-containing protein n=1 Tax=Fibrella aquatilis TaxID=2817059 RepID=A0A939G9D6_9BACT|nr:YsnF/AvaK domain-containing protein [Fibrella aquatilis]MBO0934872.1 DUF2382 domain-containing protein [Fibrella aquatilis]